MTQQIANTWSAILHSRFNRLWQRRGASHAGAARLRKQGRQHGPVAHLSAASKCVWQMDREA